MGCEIKGLRVGVFIKFGGWNVGNCLVMFSIDFIRSFLEVVGILYFFYIGSLCVRFKIDFFLFLFLYNYMSSGEI